MKTKFAKITIMAFAVLLAFSFAACSARAPYDGAAPAAEAPAAVAPAAPAAPPMMDYNGASKGLSEQQMTDAAAGVPAPSSYDREESGIAPSEPSATQAPVDGNGNTIGVPDAQMKIIRRVWLEMNSKNFDSDMAAIQAAAAMGGGFVESSNVNGRKPVEWNDSGRYANLVLRIPSENLDWFLNYANTLGEITQQNIGSEDVTAAYFDTEAHVQTLRIQLERLEAILAESEKLADVLALETEIARVRYEVEQYTTNLKQWDRLVKYSTVSISIHEETTLSRPEYTSPALGERMGTALRRSFNSTLDALENFAVFLVSIIPTLIILIPIAIVVFIIVRLAKKSYAKSEAKRKAELEARRAKGEIPAVAASGFSAPLKQSPADPVTAKDSGKAEEPSGGENQ